MIKLQTSPSPLTVSSSVLKAWRRCHMLYNYKYRQLLERKRPRVQLLRGTVIGKCLDAISLKLSNPKAPSWLRVVDEHQKKYSQVIRQDPEHFGNLMGDIRSIISRYETYYANDGLSYPTFKGQRAPYEIEIKVDLAPGILFTGHIDKMPVDKQGRTWILDHKSHKVIPSADNRFADLQLVQYFWAAPLSGLPKPSGVIWDYLRTKLPAVPELLKSGELSQRKNIDTTHDVYLAEINRQKLNPKDYAAILKDLSLRGEADFLLRVNLPGPNPAMVRTIAADMIATAKEIQRIGGTSTVRSMDRTCTQCEFFQLCQAEVRGLDSHFIRKSEYQIQKEPRHDHRQEEE